MIDFAKVDDDQIIVLKPLGSFAVLASKLQEFTGRHEPSVVT